MKNKACILTSNVFFSAFKISLYQAYFYIEKHKIDNSWDKFWLFPKLLNPKGLFLESIYSLVSGLLIFFNTHLKIINIVLVPQLIYWGLCRTNWYGRFIFKKASYSLVHSLFYSL